MQNKRTTLLLTVSVLVAALVLFIAGGVVGKIVRDRKPSAVKQRATTNEYGIAQLSGPMNPGGPTYGSGTLADLETVYNGWGSNGPIDDPNSERGYILGVKNKSKVAWHNVEAQVLQFDSSGAQIMTDPCPFGDLAPGETKRLSFGPVGKNVAMFRLIGYKGNR